MNLLPLQSREVMTKGEYRRAIMRETRLTGRKEASHVWVALEEEEKHQEAAATTRSNRERSGEYSWDV